MKAFPQGQIVCPGDGAADTIQKVSAIVNGAALGGHAGHAAPSTLIDLLAYVDSIEKLSLTRREIVLVTLLSVITAFLGFNALVGMSASNTTAGDTFRAWLLAGACLIIVVLINKFTRERLVVRELLQEATQVDAQYEHDLWEHLYYCHRHDVVFLPGLDAAVPPQHMHEFLREGREAIRAIEAREAASPPASDIIEARHMDGGYML